MFKVGIGYDSHRLTEGRKLVLGGVEIPHELGLAGHSDADVLTHAICDALLGALGKGDIGKHFPDTDEQYRGISSLKLLKNVCGLIEDSGYQIMNVDSIIIAEKPKMKDHIDAMRSNLAGEMGCESVNVKATTNEGMGAIGRGEGIAAQAVVLISKSK
jgi:2-C-methyl-D-erythritol 2,4-cyclodiphosphate synthase